MKLIIICILLYFAFFPQEKSIVEIIDVKPVILPAPAPPIPAPKPEPVVEEYHIRTLPNINSKYDASKDLLSAVLSKTKNPFVGDGRTTDAHETTHMIHAELRNARVKAGQLRDPASFFILPEYAFDTYHPKFKLAEVSAYLPKNLRFSRYDLYFVKQLKDHNDRPLYIYDEWIAYIVGAQVGIEDYDRGIKTDRVDVVEGPLEFSIYAVALCMAIKEKDPELWNDKEFRVFTKDMLKTSEKVFFNGRNKFRFLRQEEILQQLRTAEGSKPVRDFINEHFDGVFIK